MKTVIVVLFGFFLIDVLEVQAYYHDDIGIPTATKIKALEEAIQANGTINIENRIIGGEIAFNSYPFFAGLIISIYGKSENSICGSSLLSSNRLVTAAHCNYDGRQSAYKFEVVLGSNLMFFGGERFVTNEIVVHPYYDHKYFTNDIAILYLYQKVVFTNTVKPIRLPNDGEQTNTFAGYSAIAVGFGKTSTNQKHAKTVLSQVKLQVIDNAQCVRSYDFNEVTPNTICTSGVGMAGPVGTCGGDSGGPLFVYNNREPVLIGITSFGSKYFGCEAGVPAGYTRVTSFVNFIQQHLY
ncbi:collagenase-like [Spodoptera litura]|uniref:Collagenase-like n=1 Tax=Spodoptera litura TaxID=69820 RepID=A0A9J7IVW5_SPOLT|nr:collagenase-like [Spodoptera litura]